MFSAVVLEVLLRVYRVPACEHPVVLVKYRVPPDVILVRAKDQLDIGYAPRLAGMIFLLALLLFSLEAVVSLG